MPWSDVHICRVTYLSTCPATMTFASCLSTNDPNGEGGKLALWDLKTMKMEVNMLTFGRLIVTSVGVDKFFPTRKGNMLLRRIQHTTHAYPTPLFARGPFP